MKRILILSSFLTIILASCQKEIDWGIDNGGTGGGTEGDLLVKGVQITPSTNDTNIVTFKWDASKRLIEYKSAGEVNNIATNILHTINRAADGKIVSIISKSSLAFSIIDSVKYLPYYGTGTQLLYVIDTQFSPIFGNITDSIAYAYNGTGQLVNKKTYTNFFGSMDPSDSTIFAYDGSGNLTTQTSFASNGSGFETTASGITTITYDGHKSIATLGEEAHIILGSSLTATKHVTKQVTNQVATGTTYTTSASGSQFNSSDRPKSEGLSVTPQPPGYSMNVSYFYQ